VETFSPLLRASKSFKLSSRARNASEMRTEITGCCGVAAFSAMEYLQNATNYL
jgi:hypothetical protein